MNQDDKNDPAAATPQISPEPNPRLAKALTLVDNKPQSAESPPFYSNRRKQKRPPKIVTGGGADEARAYVSATTLPPNRDHQTTDMERVQVSPGLDPRRSQTLRSIRTDAPVGAPPPVPEGTFSGSMQAGQPVARAAALEAQPLHNQPMYAAQPGHAAPHGLGEAPPGPQDGSPQSSRSRTLGGHTQRILAGAAPEPAGEISAGHARPASSGPSRTVGGRTQKLPVMTPQLIAEEAARQAGGAAPAAAHHAGPSNATPAAAAGEFLRARDAARPAEASRRRRIIAALVIMVLTILVLFVVAVIPRYNRAPLEAGDLAATTLPAEVPSPPAPIPTEIAAAATVEPPATAEAIEPPAPPPELVVPTTEPSAAAPVKKKGTVRPPPRSTGQSSAGTAENPPTPPTTQPSTPPKPPPDDFILRPKEP
jgi:hypothetical protein